MSLELEVNPYESPMCEEGITIPFRDTFGGSVVEFMGSMFLGYYSFIASQYIKINPSMKVGEKVVERLAGICCDLVVATEVFAGYLSTNYFHEAFESLNSLI